MNLRLDTPSRRIAFAVGISVLLHGLVLWGPNIRLPRFQAPLPPLQAKLEALPGAPAKHRKPRAKPAVQKTAPEPVPQTGAPPQEPQLAASEPVAASAPAETGTLASETGLEAERPALPQHAQLTFAINKGTGHFRVGEAVHTLDIDDGHYVLYAVTQTVGLVRLFKSYELNQYSSGSYGKSGLHPEQFFEERKERFGTQRNTAEFDYAAKLIHFSQGDEVALPPDVQDILSVMYQFPPLAHTEIATVSVSNGRKVERYDFEITPDEEIDTPLGKLLTVHLSKMHGPNEEGLDIWLAREYRLFPVKIRFIEKDGEVAAEAVITDIRVSEEQGVISNAVN